MILISLSYLLIISFIIRTIRNLLFQSFLWQLKEYRIDRMLSHLKTLQGKKLLLSPVSLIKWILLFSGLIGVIYSYDFLILISYLCFWLLWIVEAVKAVWELITRRLRLPKFTLKIWLILTVASILTFGWFYIEDLPFFLTYGPILDKLLTPFVFGSVVILNILTWFIKKILVFLAKRKIRRIADLTVIGITGSYGKTSTKDFLYTILSKKYKTLKTEGYNNTEMAVAITVLKRLNSSYQVFIVEMGAYKKGEIRAICDIVKPQTGIITGINSQHLELFGSIQKTIEAKFELIEGLRFGGSAIFNLNNQYVKKMYERAEVQHKDLNLTSFMEGKSYTVINVTPRDLTFEVTSGNKKIICRSPVFGRQNIENVVAAAFTALQLGLTLREIKIGVGKLKPPDHTMRLFYGKNRQPLIDDTFNSNPDGMLAALEYLSLFKEKKYLVMTPLIELGKDSDKVHKLLGKKAAEICDGVYLTNANFRDSFLKGWHKKQLTKSNLPEDGAILFEGKEAGKILENHV